MQVLDDVVNKQIKRNNNIHLIVLNIQNECKLIILVKFLLWRHCKNATTINLNKYSVTIAMSNNTKYAGNNLVHLNIIIFRVRYKEQLYPK